MVEVSVPNVYSIGMKNIVYVFGLLSEIILNTARCKKSLIIIPYTINGLDNSHHILK